MVLCKIPSATESSWGTWASSHTRAGAALCSSQHICSSLGLESPTHPCRSWCCRSPHLPLRAPPNKPTYPEAALHKVEFMEASLGEEKGLLSHAPQQRLWKSSSHLSLLCLLWPSTALPPPLHFPRASPPPQALSETNTFLFSQAANSSPLSQFQEKMDHRLQSFTVLPVLREEAMLCSSCMLMSSQKPVS